MGQLGANIGDLDETDGALQGMLEEMMGQLMSKEVLYEPLKELDDKVTNRIHHFIVRLLTHLPPKFPAYIKENESKISPEEKERFDSQSACVHKVIVIFEDPNFKDGDSEKGAEIASLMNEVCDFLPF